MAVVSKICAACTGFVLSAAASYAASLGGPDIPQDAAARKELARVLIIDPLDLDQKWADMPAYLKQRIVSEPKEKWGSILLCNFFGFKSGSDEAHKCEADSMANIKNTNSQWAADGTFLGPSKECVARDKRNQYGVLLCD